MMVVVSGWKAGKGVGRLVVSCLCCIGDGRKVSRRVREPGRRMVGREVQETGDEGEVRPSLRGQDFGVRG